MLMVRIELVPYGQQDRAEEIAELRIVNDGTGTPDVGYYDVTLERTDSPLVRGRVENFSRSRGAVALVAEALITMLRTDYATVTRGPDARESRAARSVPRDHSAL